MRYKITLEEEQLKLVNKALEEYFRIRMDQWCQLADDLANYGIEFADHKEEPDIFKKQFDHMIIKRDAVQEVLECVGRILWGGFGKEKQEDVLSAIDIWETVRHKIWQDRPEPKPHDTVDSWEPMHRGRVPLPIIEKIE